MLRKFADKVALMAFVKIRIPKPRGRSSGRVSEDSLNELSFDCVFVPPSGPFFGHG